MDYEWDEAKNQRNIEKHGIGFARATAVFDGVYLSREDKRQDYGEGRHIAIGLVDAVVVVVVVYTDRKNRRRIISARSANRTERKRYHEALQQRTDR